MKKKYVFPIITMVLIISIIEILSFFFLDIVYEKNMALRYYGGLYKIPKNFNVDDFDWYFKNRYTEIRKNVGWLPIAWDSVGSRPIINKTKDMKPCISLYGDSYTYGEDVKDDETWGSYLSEMLDCRINNFGVGFYSTSQALARFEYQFMTKDEAPFIMVGFYKDNIIRNINRYRYLAYGMDRPKEFAMVATSPTYKLNKQNELDFIEGPTIAKDKYDALIKQPHLFFPDDYFSPKSISGKQYLKFPYIPKMIRNLFIIKDFYNLKVSDTIEEAFYQKNHPSKSLETTIAIFERFHTLAKERNKEIVFVLFPNFEMIHEKANLDKWLYQPIIDELEKRNFKFINVGDSLLFTHVHYNNLDAFCCNNSGHYSSEGNKLIAYYIHDQLKKLNLIAND